MTRIVKDCYTEAIRRSFWMDEEVELTPASRKNGKAFME